VRIDVNEVKNTPFPTGMDDFYIGPIEESDLSKLVLSKSAQAVIESASVPDGELRILITGPSLPGDAMNEATGFKLYELAVTYRGQQMHIFYGAPQMYIRTDTAYVETDRTKWETAEVENVAKYRTIVVKEIRWAFTLLHELGHSMGLSHPEDTTELPDDLEQDVMFRSSAFAQTDIGDIVTETEEQADFTLDDCQRLLDFYAVSGPQCLIMQENINAIK
jgi:hypothetical protein